MKKVLGLVLTALLLLAVASAALASSAGDTVNAAFSVTGNANKAIAATVKLVYDASVLEYTSGDFQNNQAGLMDLNGISTGTSLSAAFKVKSGAAAGSYPITVQVVDAQNIDEESVSGLTLSSYTVTVEAAATAAPTTAPTEAPSATVAPTEAPTEAPAATAAPTDAPTAAPTKAPEKKTSDWRYNYTVSSLGIRYRDIKPELTDKWYMFTPLDLSQDGTAKYDLIVGNQRVGGSVTVTVADGKVTVDYSTKFAVEELDMGFALLPDLDSVTDVEAIDYGKYEFGQEISIADDLGGDTSVLLQVLGHVNVDYANKYISVAGISATNPDYVSLVDSLKEIMD